MLDYYQKRITGLLTAAVVVGAITYFLLAGLPQASQTLASELAIAFEGFIFGGLTQFLFEGRRQLGNARDNRIEKYHLKLKKHVIDSWCSRTVERSQNLDSKPPSRENLYLSIDLGSHEDPDSRYFDDTQQHLETYTKLGKFNAPEQREKILRMVQDHNDKVSEFATEIQAMLAGVSGGRFRAVWQSIMDKIEPEVLNQFAVLDYLDEFRRNNHISLIVRPELESYYLIVMAINNRII